MQAVIIDYGLSNLRSIEYQLRRIGCSGLVTSKNQEILSAQRIILPGVGNFRNAIENINTMGIKDSLDEAVIRRKIPILGICLGMQMFSDYSEEGGAGGFGWIPGKTVKLLLPDSGRYKLPHVGFNTLKIHRKTGLLGNINEDTMLYFSHSFALKTTDTSVVCATTEYGHEFVSVIQKQNIYGVQFHPEKSQKTGLNILRNFMELSDVPS